MGFKKTLKRKISQRSISSLRTEGNGMNLLMTAIDRVDGPLTEQDQANLTANQIELFSDRRENKRPRTNNSFAEANSKPKELKASYATIV